MILICYDGSDDAKSAIQHAATLMPGQRATVLTVWEPFTTILAHTPAGLGPIAGLGDIQEIDEGTRRNARQRAEEGAAVACAAGLDAKAEVSAQRTSVANAILVEATRIDAGTIVLGSRGLTGLESMLLGSVSHAVAQHADRPVMIVPSPEVCRRRHDKRHAQHTVVDAVGIDLPPTEAHDQPATRTVESPLVDRDLR